MILPVNRAGTLLIESVNKTPNLLELIFVISVTILRKLIQLQCGSPTIQAQDVDRIENLLLARFAVLQTGIPALTRLLRR
jgi:hypothetical protein